MNTKITELLKIEQPLLAFSHSEQVVAAVSRAGGMGVLGAGNCSVDDLGDKLTWLGKELGDVPFGVDLLLPGTYEAKAHGGLERDELVAQVPEEHRQFAQDLLTSKSVPELAEGYSFGDVVDGGRMPIVGNHTYTARDTQPLIDACLASKASLFANALGVPAAEVLDAFHAKGVPVAGLAGTARHGEKHRQAGTDIVIAQGYEAGGHTGDIGSMVLIPDMVDAVDGLPVLAAGGIASGRQMAAAMVLGASGVWTGSVWLTTEEAETGPGVREKFLHANASDTIRSRATTGKPARQLRSAWTQAWEAGEIKPLGMPHQGILYAEPQVRLFRASDEGHAGATELVTYFVGQVVGRLNEVRPAADVCQEIVSECEEILRAGATPAGR
jgi:NAD(P)H-dependent flavin oxidoreductase YrpB (nitropropane dioxygenase family)